MAKLECCLRGNIYEIFSDIENSVMHSISASCEDKSEFRCGDSFCMVRVYERFSYLGGNRVSLSITMVTSGDMVYMSAITSGGSQAMFFKFNTFGEQAFLDTISATVKKYEV